MSETFTPSAAASRYLELLRGELGDMPADERADVLADVEVALSDEPGDFQIIVHRLGEPTAFARELRVAAGLDPPEARTSTRPPALTVVLRSLNRALESESGRRLAPLWWVARGYIAVAFVAVLLGWGQHPGSGRRTFSLGHPWLPRFGSPWVGLALVAIAVVVSVSIGLSRRGVKATADHRRLWLATNLLLVAAAGPVIHHLVTVEPATRVATVFASPTSTPGLAYDGRPLSNIYPYSRSGRLLHDVLLYDENGVPLDVGSAAEYNPNRRVLKTVAGRELFNSFPIRYFDAGTGRRRVVRHPDAGPKVTAPSIVTPRLPTPKSRRSR